MKQEGHLGYSLIINSPIIIGLNYIGYPSVSFLFTICIVVFCNFPDIDVKIERSRINRILNIEHRGITHTLLFCFVFGLLFGSVFSLIINPISISFPVGFLTGFMCIFSHILGDIFTPSGINISPLVLDKNYSLNMFNYNNIIANYGLLLTGSYTLILSYSTQHLETDVFIINYILAVILSVLIILISSRISWKYNGRLDIVRNINILRYI